MIKEKRKLDKKINSKSKGNNFELKIANLFKKHWGVTAYRTPGSGAWTSREVSQKMKEAALGDIVIDELPELIFECKNYYSLHFTNWFKENCKSDSIWNFWKKLNIEAEEFRKIPILICKEFSSPLVAIMAISDVNVIEDYTAKFSTSFYMIKGDFYLVVFDLNEILELDLETIKDIIRDIRG